MTISDNMFDFNNMVSALGKDPFKTTAKSYADERFYVLPKNDKGEGSAVIAFLPDPDGLPIQRMYKINTTITKNNQRRFINEWSPTTIGLPCPFQEKWQELYNKDKREESRLFARSTRFIANILVIKDPLKPENEGKVFLYDMSQRFKDKLEQALNPDESLGIKRKEIFNPTKGWVMHLLARKQPNDMISYDSSEFVQQTPVWPDPQEAYNNIKDKCYKLSEFLKPESFKSYDELKREFNRVTFAQEEASAETHDVQSTSSEIVDATTVQHAEPAPSASGGNSDLDDLLKDLA